MCVYHICLSLWIILQGLDIRSTRNLKSASSPLPNQGQFRVGFMRKNAESYEAKISGRLSLQVYSEVCGCTSRWEVGGG